MSVGKYFKKPIFLSVEAGNDIKKVSAEYVEAFNKVGRVQILDYKVRKLTESEGKTLSDRNSNVFKSKDGWLIKENETERYPFAIIPQKAIELSDEAMKLRSIANESKQNV